MAIERGKMLKLDAMINTNIYRNDDYGVYEVVIKNMDELMKEDDKTIIPPYEYATISGKFDRPMYHGEEYIFYVVPRNHEKYGMQYIVQITKNKFDTPARVSAFIRQFVADNIADQLIKEYGSELIQKIIDNEVDYSKIHGMGEYRFNQMRDKVLENEYMQEIIMELGEYGITPLQMRNIVERFGNNAVSIIKENPYKLCLVHGIGFKRADDIAKNMGYDMNSPNRIREAIKYCLSENENKGNSWVDQKELLYEVADLTKVQKKLINEQLEEGLEGVLILNRRVTLQKTYNMECYIADRCIELVNDKTPLNFNVDEFIKEIEAEGVILTEEQRQFLHNFHDNRINLLVGYAGCGKSFLQKYVLRIADRLNMSKLLIAPTGKASKVLSSYTGYPASTLHRAFKYGRGSEPEGTYHDLYIFDEGSMGDIPMYRVLLQCMKNPKARVLIVGDDFQLPSVGVGNVLSDMIRSGVIPTTKLTKVFRQAEGGLLDIVTKIRLGEKFLPDTFEGKKKFGTDLLIHCMPQSLMEAGYKHYYNKALKVFQVDDITVLTPTKKAKLGTVTVNSELQNIVNQFGDNEIAYGNNGVKFREGDRVMNIKNQYDVIDEDEKKHDIVNGDQGVIVKIDTNEKKVLIDFEFARVWIPYSGLENIVHSLAMTMHKSQGSGIPCVISIMDKSHKFQVNANLLYTAWTRARTSCIAVTQADVINYAIGRNANMERNTFLRELLISGVDKYNNK